MRWLNILSAVLLWVGLGREALIAAAHEEAAGHAVAAAGHAAGDHADHSLPLAAPVLAEFGWFKVTNSMFVMGLVAVGLIVFSQLATRNISLVPKGLQNFAEWVVESLVDFLGGIMGAELARKTFWFYATVFLFILSANWFGLVPGVGTIGWGHPDANGHLTHISHPILRGANADLNMTMALACAFFACWLVWSIQANGVGGFLSHIFVYHGDATGFMKLLLFLIFFLVGFLEVISIMIRPVSLTFRLFGNIYAGESLLELMLTKGGMLGFLPALPFYGLELMVGGIQALVFTLLTAVFTALMCKHEDSHAPAEAGGHGGGH